MSTTHKCIRLHPHVDTFSISTNNICYISLVSVFCRWATTRLPICVPN